MIKSVFTSENHGNPFDSEIELYPDVILLLLEDSSARLLHFGGSFFALPSSSAEMLLEVLKIGVEPAVSQIAERYHVSNKRVRDDLDNLLASMEKQKIIYRRPSNGIAFEPKKNTISNWMVQSSLKFIYRFSGTLKSRTGWLMTLARISCYFLGWSSTVSAWQQYHDKKIEDESSFKRNSAQINRIDQYVREVAARHLLGVGCKERALACWSLLRSKSISVKLIVGVHLFPLASHCWCEVDSLILSDDEDRCKRFTPLIEY